MFVVVKRAVPKGGDLTFEAFFEAEYERLLKTMFAMCRNRAEAEDLAQGAMARAFERWNDVASAESPVAYVYAIAFNAHRSALRRAAVAARRLGRPATEPETPETVAERRQEILDALRSLPRAQQEALLLVEWVGMTSEEAALVLDIEPASVRGRVHRARRSLQERSRGNDDD